MLPSIQVGLDIATSVSVIGAAVALVISQKRQRELQRYQYNFDNLKGIISFLKERSQEWPSLRHSARIKILADIEGTRQNPKFVTTVLILKVEFFLKSIKQELHTQAGIIFRILMGSDAPDSVIALEVELDDLLARVKSTDQKVAIAALDDVGPFLEKAIETAAQVLRDKLCK